MDGGGGAGWERHGCRLAAQIQDRALEAKKIIYPCCDLRTEVGEIWTILRYPGWLR